MFRTRSMIALAIIGAFCTAAFGATATQVSQHGITWFLSTSREVGQFVNGDWWVVGPVTINSYSPGPSGGCTGRW